MIQQKMFVFNIDILVTDLYWCCPARFISRLRVTLHITLKGGCRVLQHSNRVSNTYFHKLLGGFQEKNKEKKINNVILSFEIQLNLRVPAS